MKILPILRNVRDAIPYKFYQFTLPYRVGCGILDAPLITMKILLLLRNVRDAIPYKFYQFTLPYRVGCGILDAPLITMKILPILRNVRDAIPYENMSIYIVHTKCLPLRMQAGGAERSEAEGI